MVLGLANLPLAGLSGFLFGSGYGAGVRFGYEDLYPTLRGKPENVDKVLKTPYQSSGFKLAADIPTNVHGIGDLVSPDAKTPVAPTTGTGIPNVDRDTVHQMPEGTKIRIGNVYYMKVSGNTWARAYGKGNTSSFDKRGMIPDSAIATEINRRGYSIV